jgi:hypothetical protein
VLDHNRQPQYQIHTPSVTSSTKSAKLYAAMSKPVSKIV